LDKFFNFNRYISNIFHCIAFTMRQG